MTVIQDQGHEEFNLGDFVQALWKTRRFVISVTLLFVMAALALIIFLRIAMPPTTTHQHLIRFVFPGSTVGKYPNNKLFSISDLLAPAIVDRVYSTNNLQKYGLKKRDFVNSLSILPYSRTHSFISERYRKRLANRKLSFVEKQQIETNMKNELEKQEESDAMLRMVLQDRISIPDEIALQVLQSITREWAIFQIETQGVLKLPEAMISKDIIDLSLVDGQTPFTSLSYLMSKVSTIQSKVSKLRDLDGIETIVDKKSKIGISELQNELNDFNKFHIEAMLGKLTGHTSQNSRIELKIMETRTDLAKLELKKIYLKVAALKEQLREYDNRQGAFAKLNGANLRSAPKGEPSLETSITQLSEGFLDRIIQLSERQKEDIDFRKSLIKKQLEHRNEAANLGHLIARNEAIKKLLPPLNSSQSSPERNATNIDQQKKISGELRGFSNKLNEYWAVLGRLSEMLSSKRISYMGDLFRPLVLESKERSFSYHPVINKQVGLIMFLLAIGAALFAALAHLAWQIVTRKKN